MEHTSNFSEEVHARPNCTVVWSNFTTLELNISQELVTVCLNMSNDTTTPDIHESQPLGYWEIVESDIQYLVSQAIGRYVLLPIFLLGTVGNLMSFAVMIRRSMRASSTAFYMAALALADTLVLLVGCLRRWVIEVWSVDLLNINVAACHIVNFLQYFSFDLAVWILVAMTVDRVVVVTTPLKAYKYATRKRAAIALIILAVLCVGINLHFFFTTYLDDRGVCTSLDEYRVAFFEDVWSWVDGTVYSFLPFVLLLIFNVVIIAFLAKADRRKRSMTSNFSKRKKTDQRNTLNPRKLTLMLLSVTVAFVILTAPGVVLNGLRQTGFDLANPHDTAKYILTRQVSRVLLYLNHSINFFLYCITGEKFRMEIVAMFKCQTARDRYRRSNNTATSLASIAQTTSSKGSNNNGCQHNGTE